jgi:hypothetical protein
MEKRRLLRLSDLLPNRVEVAKNVLRSSSFYDFDEAKTAMKDLQTALRLYTLNSAYFDFNLKRISFRPSLRNLKLVFKAISGEQTNIFEEFYERYWSTWLLNENLSLVGISISAEEQIIPGLILASLIKRQMPEVHICLGGRPITRLGYRIESLREIWRCFDSIVCGDGERSIVELADALLHGKDLTRVPNLVFKDNQGRIIRNEYSVDAQLDALPFPIFGKLPLDRYFLPEVVFPVEMGRGCYWSNCTFCEETDIKHRIRNTSYVLENIRCLVKEHNARYFTIVDPCCSPTVLQQFGRQLIEGDIEIYWNAFVRAEKSLTSSLTALLRKSGCLMLMLGIESGSRRILELMKKGIDVEYVPLVLKNVSAANIWTHAYFMRGFPTESYREFHQTVNLVTKCAENLDSVTLSHFVMPTDTVIASKYITNSKHAMEPTDAGLSLYVGHRKTASVGPRNPLEEAKIGELWDSAINMLLTDSRKWGLLEINQILLHLGENGKAFFLKRR